LLVKVVQQCAGSGESGDCDHSGALHFAEDWGDGVGWAVDSAGDFGEVFVVAVPQIVGDGDNARVAGEV